MIVSALDEEATLARIARAGPHVRGEQAKSSRERRLPQWSNSELFRVGPGSPLQRLCCVSSSAAPRSAPFVDVKYDLVEASGVYSMTAFRYLHPPRFRLTSEQLTGTQTIRYSSDSALNALNGPVSLRTLKLTINAPAYTDYYIGYYDPPPIQVYTSTLRLEAVNLPLAGTLSGSAVDLEGRSPLLRVTGRFHCYTDCARLNLTTTVSTSIQPSTSPLWNASFFTTNGASTLNARVRSFFFRLDPGEPSTQDLYTAVFPDVVFGSLYSVSLTGREISRTPVPEPDTLGLMSAGLAALALAGAAGWMKAHRRRRESRTDRARATSS